MRNMSFSLTTEQIRNQTKTVTRRVGWEDLKAGDLIQAVEKCQGLRRGEQVKKICIISIISVRREKLNDIYKNSGDVIREGFLELNPVQFVMMFCKANTCKPEKVITRIEFSYNILTESISWIPVEQEVPDCDMTVNIFAPEANEPIWLGYWDGDNWVGIDGSILSSLVTHWAPMLNGPKEVA